MIIMDDYEASPPTGSREAILAKLEKLELLCKVASVHTITIPASARSDIYRYFRLRRLFSHAQQRRDERREIKRIAQMEDRAYLHNLPARVLNTY